LAPGAACAADYLDDLIHRSRELHLSERREWHRLMHYIDNLVSPGVHGLADANRFYLAADGKTNPQGELEATLAAFFSDAQETETEQNPQCSFIARYHWLDSQLGFDPARLKKQTCKRFSEWREALNPGGVTLVFPAAFLNSPTSMYGHTLLRIDAKDQDERTRLLAYAMNFTAATTETNGVIFAIGGVIGTFPGMFSVLPYYLKVREYSDLENRDIWEYELNLTPDEVDRLLMHAWELRSVYFYYYFFDENCAYYLLELLEAARPDLDLTSAFRWWAIPSDTVRKVVEQKGLLKRTVYRPSNATLIAHRLGFMEPSDQTLSRLLGRGEIGPGDPAIKALPDRQKARVLEVGRDYLDYLRARGKSSVQNPDELGAGIVAERSRIPEGANDPPVPVPETAIRSGRPAME